MPYAGTPEEVREKKKAYNLKWYSVTANREQKLAQCREYYANNREKKLARQRLCYAEKSEVRKAKKMNNQKWRAGNPEKEKRKYIRHREKYLTDPEYRKQTDARTKKWSMENPEKRLMTTRKSRLRHMYGLSLEDYDRMYHEQWGMCPICGEVKESALNPKTKRNDTLHVEHCHKSGKIRALVCDKCNKGLGHFRDNIAFLQNAIDYIKFYKEA